MSDVTLENTPENQQLSRLQQLVSEQNWPQAYDLVATALQGKNISSGVSYFFQQRRNGVRVDFSCPADNLSAP